MHFAQQGNTFLCHDDSKTNILPVLPPATYVMKYSMQAGLYLELVDDFVMPAKIYGTTDKDADRILHTFNDRPAQTGVLLDGEKGSGKTLLAKLTSLKALAAGMPTILVNQGYAGDAFSEFVQGMHQPAIFLLDEFEKTHDGKAQQNLLTLLDGVMSSKKLFLLTVNEIGKLSDFLTNRPGRLFYHFSYDGLTLDFVREYAKDQLNDKSENNVEGVVAAALVAGRFNFDQLSSLVQEMNRYKENVVQAIKHLNISSRQRATFCDIRVSTNTGVTIKLNSRDDMRIMDPLGGEDFDVTARLDMPVTDEHIRNHLKAAGRPYEIMERTICTVYVEPDMMTNYNLLTGEFNYFVPMAWDEFNADKDTVKALGAKFNGFNVKIIRRTPKVTQTISETLAMFDKK